MEKSKPRNEETKNPFGTKGALSEMCYYPRRTAQSIDKSWFLTQFPRIIAPKKPTEIYAIIRVVIAKIPLRPVVEQLFCA